MMTVVCVRAEPKYQGLLTPGLLKALQAHARMVSEAWRLQYVEVTYGTSADVMSAQHRISVMVRDSLPTDPPSVLGHHAVDGGGQPYAVVFPDRCTADLVAVSVVLSHEIADTLVNPFGNLAAVDNFEKVWALEVCDAVQTTTFLLHGITVTNFVLPAFFTRDCKRGPFDLLKVLPTAFTVNRGGYKQIHTLLGWRVERKRIEE